MVAEPSPVSQHWVQPSERHFRPRTGVCVSFSLLFYLTVSLHPKNTHTHIHTVYFFFSHCVTIIITHTVVLFNTTPHNRPLDWFGWLSCFEFQNGILSGVRSSLLSITVSGGHLLQYISVYFFKFVYVYIFFSSVSALLKTAFQKYFSSSHSTDCNPFTSTPVHLPHTSPFVLCRHFVE